jgi:alcohol dehydrogenase
MTLTPSSITDAPIALARPTLVGFGPGAVNQCTDYLASRRFGRAFLLLSPHLRGLEELIGQWRASVDELVIADGIPAEPGIEDCQAMLEAAGPEPVDAVIGMGGGSVLDVAKVVAVAQGSGRSVRELLAAGKPPGRVAALVCLPTTSGTGSEVSPNAILYDAEAGEKRALIGPPLVPDAAFVDPVLTLSLPADATAATGIDALSHCIEAYTNRRAHPVIDLYALEGIRLIAGMLERAVRDGADLEARTRLSLGSLYGGYCLGPVNTAAVHALSYPLGSRFRLPHGLSNALLLPHVMRFNIPACPDRHAAVARAMGVREAGDEAAVAEAGVRFVEQLARRCGLPAGMAGCGVTRADIPDLAGTALLVTRLLDNNPRTVTRADAETIYQQAL